MTQISRDTVLHLARLSKLELDDDEVGSLTTDITNILGYVELLDQLDTENVKPTYQVISLENIWREDTVVAGDVGTERLLQLAPDVADNQVKVPKVL